MKKYVKPTVQMIQFNDLDIIRTSELLFPVIPLSGMEESSKKQDI